MNKTIIVEESFPNNSYAMRNYINSSDSLDINYFITELPKTNNLLLSFSVNHKEFFSDSVESVFNWNLINNTNEKTNLFIKRFQGDLNINNHIIGDNYKKLGIPSCNDSSLKINDYINLYNIDICFNGTTKIQDTVDPIILVNNNKTLIKNNDILYKIDGYQREYYYNDPHNKSKSFVMFINFFQNNSIFLCPANYHEYNDCQYFLFYGRDLTNEFVCQNNDYNSTVFINYNGLKNPIFYCLELDFCNFNNPKFSSYCSNGLQLNYNYISRGCEGTIKYLYDISLFWITISFFIITMGFYFSKALSIFKNKNKKFLVTFLAFKRILFNTTSLLLSLIILKICMGVLFYNNSYNINHFLQKHNLMIILTIEAINLLFQITMIIIGIIMDKKHRFLNISQYTVNTFCDTIILNNNNENINNEDMVLQENEDTDPQQNKPKIIENLINQFNKNDKKWYQSEAIIDLININQLIKIVNYMDSYSQHIMKSNDNNFNLQIRKNTYNIIKNDNQENDLTLKIMENIYDITRKEKQENKWYQNCFFTYIETNVIDNILNNATYFNDLHKNMTGFKTSWGTEIIILLCNLCAVINNIFLIIFAFKE